MLGRILVLRNARVDTIYYLNFRASFDFLEGGQSGAVPNTFLHYIEY